MTKLSTILSTYKIKIKHIAGNKNTAVDASSQKFIKDKDKDVPKQAIPDKLINKSIFPAEELANKLILEEKWNILRQHHDSPTARHPSIKEILYKVSKQHLWLELKQFVTNYIKSYENCQRYKINQHPLKPLLQEIPVPQSNRPFAQIAMDFITNLPKSKGFDSILSVVDHSLTKGIILILTTKEVTLESVRGHLHFHPKTAWQHSGATLACLLVILKHTSLAPILPILILRDVYNVQDPFRSLILISEDSPGGELYHNHNL